MKSESIIPNPFSLAGVAGLAQAAVLAGGWLMNPGTSNL
jgi:hypothetical protein